MKNNDLVSVIIPTYNCGPYLNRSIDSVINQSFTDLEILIVDDGSTDNTHNIVQNIIKTDPRVKYFYKQNGGVSSARNYGLKNCNGKYVCFLDADDTYYKDSIKTFVSTMQEFDVDLVCGQVVLKYKNMIVDKSYINESVIVGDSHNPHFIARNMKPYTYKTVWLKCFKKGLIKDLTFDENESYAEDDLFVLNYLGKINKLAIISNHIVSYNIGERKNSLIAIANKDIFNSGESVSKKTLESAKQIYPNSPKLWYLFARRIVTCALKQIVNMQNSNIDKTSIINKTMEMFNNKTFKEVMSYYFPQNSVDIFMHELYISNNLENLIDKASSVFYNQFEKY